MTLSEKVSLCHAGTKFSVKGIERLGIPDFAMSDVPHGVREEISADSWEPAGWNTDFCTYQPTGAALAATWNLERAADFGHVLGSEARKREKDIILGPGINIVRTPLCGRNFEYYGEDPHQISKMVVPTIKAIQEEDVAADIKHYALNNQELNRHGTDVEVDERPLREIYLRGFEAAVKDGEVLTLMGSYNLIRGQHGCHHEYLLNKILKDEWGFKGLRDSDIEIIFAQGYPEASLNMSYIGADTMASVEPGSGVKGWNATFRNTRRPSGDPVFSRTESYIDIEFNEGNIPAQITNDLFCVEWIGKVIAPETGKYNLGVNTDRSLVVYINGKQTIKLVSQGSIRTETAEFDLVEGSEYDVKVVATELPKDAVVKFGWAKLGDNILGKAERIDEAIKAAQESDIVLFFGGLNHQYDIEGCDRTDMKLHSGQNELVDKLLNVNEKLVFFNTSGCPVEMPWMDRGTCYCSKLVWRYGNWHSISKYYLWRCQSIW